MAETLKDYVTIEPLPDEEGGNRDERRYSSQLYSYWNQLRGKRLFPSEDVLNPEAIAHIWPHCFLIQVNDLKNRKRADFTYLGSEILRVYHDLLSLEDTGDFISPSSSHLSQNFWQVIETHKPIMQSGQFTTSRGNLIKFRQCLLPLGKSDSEVEAIFGSARLKLYP